MYCFWTYVVCMINDEMENIHWIYFLLVVFTKLLNLWLNINILQELESQYVSCDLWISKYVHY